MEHEPTAKVLVVDGEAAQAYVLAAGLRIEGFDVETARDAEAALRAMASDTFDLAIVDLMLPGTNGIQLARTIRLRFPHARVVLMSAYHLSERQVALADCGVIGFVPSPFELKELAGFLRSKIAGVDSAAATVGGEE
jgi:DNA-binding response OmpR family regulator